jgi:hypothetical protein
LPPRSAARQIHALDGLDEGPSFMSGTNGARRTSDHCVGEAAGRFGSQLVSAETI